MVLRMRDCIFDERSEYLEKILNCSSYFVHLLVQTCGQFNFDSIGYFECAEDHIELQCRCRKSIQKNPIWRLLLIDVFDTPIFEKSFIP